MLVKNDEGYKFPKVLLQNYKKGNRMSYKKVVSKRFLKDLDFNLMLLLKQNSIIMEWILKEFCSISE